MFLTTFTRVPIWVWPLFIALLIVGVRASQKRDSALIVIYALPLLGLLSLNRVQSFAQAELGLSIFFFLHLIGLALGFRIQGDWIVFKTARKVTLRGEWFTFVSVMVLFSGNIVTGIFLNVAPTIAGTMAFVIAFGSITGLVSGSLSGRALRVAFWPKQPI